MRFDSASHLEAWMNAPERKEMLNESKAFIEHEQLTRWPRRFPDGSRQIKNGSRPAELESCHARAAGLFPIVMLESFFLMPRLTSLNFSLALFIGNTISVH